MNQTLILLLKMLVEMLQSHEGRLIILEKEESGESTNEAALMQEVNALVLQLEAPTPPVVGDVM